MEPQIRFKMGEPRRRFGPGETLDCEYRIEAARAEDVQAVEECVLWRTEGKGDEDFGVHYFRRRTRRTAPGGDLRPPRRFSVLLPLSPLTYEGRILRLAWCVRVRLFLSRGRELAFEQPFRLGCVPSPEAWRE